MDREKEEAQAKRKQSLRNEDENGQREGTESIGGSSRGKRDTGGVPRFLSVKSVLQIPDVRFLDQQ